MLATFEFDRDTATMYRFDTWILERGPVSSCNQNDGMSMLAIYPCMGPHRQVDIADTRIVIYDGCQLAVPLELVDFRHETLRTFLANITSVITTDNDAALEV